MDRQAVTFHRWIGIDADDECMTCGVIALDGSADDMDGCPGLDSMAGRIYRHGISGLERVR